MLKDKVQWPGLWRRVLRAPVSWRVVRLAGFDRRTALRAVWGLVRGVYHG